MIGAKNPQIIFIILIISVFRRTSKNSDPPNNVSKWPIPIQGLPSIPFLIL